MFYCIVISMTQDKQIRELKQKLALYSGSTQQQQHNSYGLANLNGFNTSPGNSSSSVNDIELVNRCFSSCSPNSVVASAASPSSLSSGTPPLPVGTQPGSLIDHHRSLCNVSPVGAVGSGPVSSSINSGNSVNASPFSMLSAAMRDYSLDNCLNSGWPSSLHNNSNKNNNHNNHGSSPSPSSLMGANNLSSPSSVSSACSSLIGSHSVAMVTSNGQSANNNSKAPGTPLGGGSGGAGSGTKLSDYENAPNKGVTPNLSFTNRFDI